jgi:hypothetical protein
LPPDLGYPHVNSLRKKFLADRPERAIYAALHAEVASATDRVVVVCEDYRCPIFTAFFFGFEPPANLVVVAAPGFATAPLPERAKVRLIAHLQPSGGLARRAEDLGLRPIVWDPDVRLYDAGDGARLHDALATP